MNFETIKTDFRTKKKHRSGVFQNRVHVSVYLYGFNGMERDDEARGKGNQYQFGDYSYDPRLVRRFNQDPVVKEHESPYAAFANNPIWFADNNGKDTLVMHKKDIRTAYGVVVSKVTFSLIKDGIERNLNITMFMGANAFTVQLPQGESFKLEYKTMSRYPNWKETIYVHYDKVDNGIFLHRQNLPDQNLGCLCLSETEPHKEEISTVDYYGNTETRDRMYFDATKEALISVQNLYKEHESDLTGDKFLLKTESTASDSSINLKSKTVTGISLSSDGSTSVRTE